MASDGHSIDDLLSGCGLYSVVGVAYPVCHHRQLLCC